MTDTQGNSSNNNWVQQAEMGFKAVLHSNMCVSFGNDDGDDDDGDDGDGHGHGHDDDNDDDDDEDETWLARKFPR